MLLYPSQVRIMEAGPGFEKSKLEPLSHSVWERVALD